MSSSFWSVISLMNQTILEPYVGTLSSAHKIGKGILKTATSNLIGFTQFPGVLGVHRFISKPENIVFTRSHAVRMSSFEEDLEAVFEKVWSTEYLNKFTCTASHCLRCINWQHVRSHQLCFVLRVTLNYGKLFNTLFRVNIPKWVVVGLNNLRCGLHFMLYQSS